MRAWNFERRVEEEGGELERICWEEMKGRAKKGKALKRWAEQRKEFWVKRGWRLEEMERLREAGQLRGEDLCEKEKKSQYNRWYKMKGEGIPGYLKRGWSENRWRSLS
ncbi:hypothetical protein X777_11296 [Ooceraea biroi]|uniref:Uncharacterized protein n=1 Tax=Ooceraea biroi TaxID=2015173 RepID=A0A026W2H0_OOCBI|nr:hypothetical protein X777_11296 [Ooceraea biroi]